MRTSYPRILSVGTSNPPTRYTQKEILERYRVDNPMVRSIFEASHIEGRYLYLPPTDATGAPVESQGALLQKHRTGALEMGAKAIKKCLDQIGASPEDVDMLCCITSTGFMLPGLTAMFIKHLGFRINCHRMDLVGMGCNAGLNGLNPATAWAAANQGKLVLMVCCEVNSALYVFDDKIGTGVVNSLFGDGCVATAIRASLSDDARFAPSVLHFESHLMPDTWRAMSYHWSDEHGKFYFNLARDVPYVLGANAQIPVQNLLKPFRLHKRDISHWIIHSGGKKVIDAIKYTVGITAHDVRHTTKCLKEYGNLGSGAFLFAYQSLLQEGTVQRGDYAVMMTMGPGSTIETALLRW